MQYKNWEAEEPNKPTNQQTWKVSEEISKIQMQITPSPQHQLDPELEPSKDSFVKVRVL